MDGRVERAREGGGDFSAAGNATAFFEFKIRDLAKGPVIYHTKDLFVLLAKAKKRFGRKFLLKMFPVGCRPRLP